MTWESTEPSTVESEWLTFRAKDLTKIYQAGEVDVVALRGVDLALFTVGAGGFCSARPAAASRRF